MTTITVEQDGLYCRISCKEHAGDVAVCAAISFGVSALANYVLGRTDAHMIECHLNSGDSEVIFVGDYECTEVFSAIVQGFEQLQELYKDHIKVVRV